MNKKPTTITSKYLSTITVAIEKQIPFFIFLPDKIALTISPIRNGKQKLNRYPIVSDFNKLSF